MFVVSLLAAGRRNGRLQTNRLFFLSATRCCRHPGTSTLAHHPRLSFSRYICPPTDRRGHDVSFAGVIVRPRHLPLCKPRRVVSTTVAAIVSRRSDTEDSPSRCRSVRRRRRRRGCRVSRPTRRGWLSALSFARRRRRCSSACRKRFFVYRFRGFSPFFHLSSSGSVVGAGASAVPLLAWLRITPGRGTRGRGCWKHARTSGSTTRCSRTAATTVTPTEISVSQCPRVGTVHRGSSSLSAVVYSTIRPCDFYGYVPTKKQSPP